MPDGVQQQDGQQSQSQGTALYETPFDPAQHVPEALRTEPYFSSFKGKPLAEVIKSGLEAHKALGGSVRIPGKDAKDEDWQAYYSKLRPEKFEGAYKPEWTDKEFGAKLEGPVLNTMLQGFYEAGLHPRQVAHIMKAYEAGLAGEIKSGEQAAQTARSGNVAALREKYKDQFDTASNMTNRAARRFGGDGFVKLVKDLGLETDPVFFETFYNIGKAIHEDSWHTGNAPTMLSRENAGNKVKEILNDSSHPYHHASHPQHAAAVEQMNGFRKIQHSKQEEEF